MWFGDFIDKLWAFLAQQALLLTQTERQELFLFTQSSRKASSCFKKQTAGELLSYQKRLSCNNSEEITSLNSSINMNTLKRL